MAGQALYRKYRPRRFSEVIGQEHVVRTLRNALLQGRIVHAYLFTGPRGTGKTSTARILAKAVNCLAQDEEKPCQKCSICRAMDEGRCMDLIEIDGASNRGIDEVRELRERVNFAPSEAATKFYIIDEVHMLTLPAFNALLKTLEEPPPHAYFILATTEPHKVPPTIISRCQRFDFRPIPLQEIIARLEWIAEQEGLGVEPEALDLIARQATGSVRDADSLLDQVASYGEQPITLAQVQAILGLTLTQAVSQLAASLATQEVSQGLRIINQAIADGADPKQFGRQLIDYLRDLLLLKVSGEAPHLTPEAAEEMAQRAQQFTLPRLLATIRLFSQATFAPKTTFPPQLPLEMAFVEATLLERASSPSSQEPPARRRVSRPSPAGVELPPGPPSPKGSEERPRPVREEPSIETPRERRAPPSTDLEALERVKEAWEGLLAQVKRRNMHVEALLKSCQPVAVGREVVTLAFYYPFHKGKIEDPRCKGLVQEVLSEIMGQPYQIECVLVPQEEREGREKQPPSPPKPSDELGALREDPLIKAALEMGGKIVEVHEDRSVEGQGGPEGEG